MVNFTTIDVQFDIRIPAPLFYSPDVAHDYTSFYPTGLRALFSEPNTPLGRKIFYEPSDIFAFCHNSIQKSGGY